jgi:hypothetical protein
LDKHTTRILAYSGSPASSSLIYLLGCVYPFLGELARTLRRWRGTDTPASSTGGSLAIASRGTYKIDSGVADKPCASTLSRIVQVAAAISRLVDRLIASSWDCPYAFLLGRPCKMRT